MSNTAPERIWVCPLGVHENEVDWTEGNWTDQPEFCGSETEYVRADLLATARAALAEIERLYYAEGKDAGWRAAQMRGVATSALTDQEGAG